MQNKNLIGGQWVAADSAQDFPVTDPATDEIITRVPNCGAPETRRAIAAAYDAWPAWRAKAANQRAEAIDQLAALMRRDADRLARLMTQEQGKPLSESRGEINYAISFLDHAAEEAKRISGEIIPASSPDKRILVMRQPVGVCAIITPWNFPSAMITRKLGPALAAGCTVVIKPAEDTPLSAIALGELAMEAGIPAGVINIITGDAKAIGAELTSDQRVRKLSFTGSTEVGRILMEQSSQTLLRLSMELGGHAPFIVFADADMSKVAEAALACKFRNAGQTCICANRFYIHESVHAEFVARFQKLIESLRVGRGTTEGVSIGPLINDDAIDKVEAHVADARDKGGKVLTGGGRVRVEGCADRFYAPTLIDNMTADMRIHTEETFGPVAAVRAFNDEEQVIEWANSSEFGLAGYFFTRDASRLMRVAEKLEYGIVGANDAAPSTAQAPFGGVKQSGFGREGGRYVMDEYTQIKYVSWGL